VHIENRTEAAWLDAAGQDPLLGPVKRGGGGAFSLSRTSIVSAQSQNIYYHVLSIS
jgi:hypothetical protein